MITEHAVSYKETLSPTDLDYLIKKANHLGETGRKIYAVYSQIDKEGTHIYFEVEGLKEKN